ncbi:MAG: cytochrome b/b6 domain-containing protein [Candidatus Heimdallarchaeota archaeon]|nr:MAG: cytochrome b/b6 domain-containing protein [Candidatus Heimdallarchaeota archaeon]
MVTVHKVDSKKPVEKATDVDGSITVVRYNNLQRFHHWVHVIVMILFFLTGFELFIKVYFLGDYFFTRSLHLVLGIFAGFWDIIFFGAITIGYRKVNEIVPYPRDFLDIAIIVLCAIGILPDEKYPKYDFYLREKKKYVMKYHPLQKLLTVSNVFMIFLMGVTGIALAEELVPGSTGILSILGLLVFPFQIFELDIRFIHFGIYVYFLFTTLVHFYFAVIPQNRHRLKGMVTGKEKIRVS